MLANLAVAAAAPTTTTTLNTTTTATTTIATLRACMNEYSFLSVSCETKTRGLDALLRVLGERRAKALVAVLDSPMCEITVKLAHLWNMPLFTWTCPLVSRSKSTLVRVDFSFIRNFSERPGGKATFVDRQAVTVLAYDSESPCGNVDALAMENCSDNRNG